MIERVVVNRAWPYSRFTVLLTPNGPVEVAVCDRCGSLAWDESRHEDFHEFHPDVYPDED